MFSIADVVRRFSRDLEPVEAVDIVGEADWAWPVFRMLACDARDQVACTAAAQGWDAFERPMPRLVRQAVAHAGRGIFVDVGANTGFYSLLALAASRSIRVVAYEPLGAVRTILASNLTLNRPMHRRGRRARISPHAISDACGTATLFVPDQQHGLVETSASLSANFKAEQGARVVVKTTSLDAAFARRSRVAVIKIDAEGHDLNVLRGAMKLLRRDRPTVFVEVLLGADEAGLTDILQTAGYVDVVLRQDMVAGPNQAVRHDPEAWNHMWLPAENPHI